jgi:DNA-binding PucR family transcriptional regulator
VLDEAVVAERVARIADELIAKTAELTTEMVGVLAADLPHLVHDDERTVSLMAASTQQNIDAALQIFRYNMDPTRAEAPVAAVEYARRLAQRGTPVVDLIRAYHLGQATVLDHAMSAAVRISVELADPTELLGAVVRRALAVSGAFIDRVTQGVISVYQEERDRWLLNRSAVRAATVRAVLGDDGVDIDASEAALGYRLRGTHIGMVMWHGGAAQAGNALGAFERVIADLSVRASCSGGVLFVPHDEVSAWVWLPVDEDAVPWRAHLDSVLAGGRQGVRAALGEPGCGLDGFRRTHRQALRVRDLGLAMGKHAGTVMTFAEVGSIALMASDLESARAWVADILGPMAIDDEQQQRLRETVRVFLAAGGSYTAAASQLTMHKNSVQYRVRKAEELLGRQLTENRLDVELALKLCHWLGAAVLKANS